MRRIDIQSLDHPELEPYRTLREHTRHWQGDHVVAEGEKTVRALLASQLDVLSVLLDEHWLGRLREDIENPRFDNTDVYVAQEQLLEGIVGFNMHQNLMAIARVPESAALESMHTEAPGRHVHVALEGIADAENMGMILRNCAAFGVRSLIVGSDSSNPWLRRSVRVSLGNVFGLRIHRCDDLHVTLQECRERFGWKVVGTTPRGGSSVIERDIGAESEHICLLVGSEAYGLSEQAFDLCNALFTIPMSGDVDSINVANATAVALFEATRYE